MTSMILAAAATSASSAVGAKAEEIVLRLLIQIVAILLATRVVVAVTNKLGQTDVSGEILAGLLLGPSFLGAFAPGVMQRIFDPSTSQIFVGLAQIGLVLLMFQIGLEFEFGANLKTSKRSIVVVSLVGIAVPFCMGLWSADWFHGQLATPRPPLLGFRLFFAIAMSITAIPILGRIFMELGLSHTRTAALTIGAAAVDDVAGWLLLGVVTLIVEDNFVPLIFLLRIGALVAYVAVIFFVVRPPLKRALAREHTLSLRSIGLVLIVLFVSGTITSSIGVFAIIGGFVIGVALHDDRQFVEQWRLRVSPLVTTLFLPIFFAYTGLRTDVRGLSGGHAWLVCFLVSAVAIGSKLGGVYVGARLVSEPPRSAFAIAICMNTRALMELIAINIGYDLGLIPRSMFTMLVIMAIVSTFMATPLINWLMRKERVLEPAGSLVRAAG